MKLFNKKAQTPKETPEEMKKRIMENFAKTQEMAKNSPSWNKIIFETRYM